ncbi:hypothetical protein ABFX02_04G006300 [Erythranthe guttata]
MIKKSKRGGEDGRGGSNSMEKVDNRISDLPEGLLQRIVYFLSQEEAVRTSVLSKSWRYIWCRRPNFDLSEPKFKGNKHQFLSVVERSLQGYCDPNGLLLEEFRLSINLLGGGGDDHHHQAHEETVRVLDKWIPIILTTTMGIALKEFRLSIIYPKKSHSPDHPPHRGLVYDLLLINNKKLHFGGLQVLGLRKVLIKQESLDNIFSTCTLLTTMHFKECRGIKTIKLDKKLHKYLKHFTFISDDFRGVNGISIENHYIEIDDVPTLETIKIVGSNVRFHVRGRNFTNLKSVTLKLSYHTNYEICIDAPNLLYFGYTGSIIPSISFAPNCRTSNIRLVNSDGFCIDALSWLLKISQLLQALCHSQISLYIHQTRRYIDSICIPQPDLFVDKPVVVVKHLQMCYFEIYTISSALNGLLCICRPKRITQPGIRRHYLSKEIEEKKIKEYLRTILIARGSVSQEIRRDLEAVTSQKSETLDKCERWQPIQWAAFLECPQLSGIRFQLKWSEVCHSSSKLRKLVRMLDK